jgi:hypothetical protein
VLAVADFLNAREKATIIWGVLLLIYVWRKDRSIGWSFLRVFLAMFHPKLLIIWAATAIYTATLVFAAYTAHLWHTTALKETLYWFVATGAVLAGGATTAQFDRAYARRLARKALRFTLSRGVPCRSVRASTRRRARARPARRAVRCHAGSDMEQMVKG